jgi:hypothetical protein
LQIYPQKTITFAPVKTRLSIILLFFTLVFSTNTKASTTDAHESYKESYSSFVGFFGKDLVLKCGGKNDHTDLKSHFFKRQFTTLQNRNINSFFLFNIPLSYSNVFFNETVEKPNFYFFICALHDAQLYKLFNNYRI